MMLRILMLICMVCVLLSGCSGVRSDAVGGSTNHRRNAPELALHAPRASIAASDMKQPNTLFLGVQ